MREYLLRHTARRHGRFTALQGGLSDPEKLDALLGRVLAGRQRTAPLRVWNFARRLQPGFPLMSHPGMHPCVISALLRWLLLKGWRVQPAYGFGHAVVL